jgi:hypothetical protein
MFLLSFICFSITVFLLYGTHIIAGCCYFSVLNAFMIKCKQIYIFGIADFILKGKFQQIQFFGLKGLLVELEDKKNKSF